MTETAYGSVLKVEGEIAEAHSVKSMTLTVYGSDGTKEIAKWTEENINTAGSTKVTFAKYISNGTDSDTLYKNYSDIYNITKGGDQSFSCSVTLCDSAAIYQKPSFVPSYARTAGSGSASSSGNTTSDVWLYDDIYGSDADYMLMGTKAAEVWEKSFELTDLMNLLNGTETYDKTNADGDTVLDVLEKARKNTADKRLKFKLNKDANPTYTVMGFSFDGTAESDDRWNMNPMTRGGMITLKADAGLDGIQFSPESIKVYLFGPFEAAQLSDAAQGILAGSDSIYNDPEEYAKKHPTQLVSLLYDGKNGVDGAEDGGPYTGESLGTWTQQLTLPSEIIAEYYYIIAATGRDKDDVEFVSSGRKYMGFKGQALGIPPSVTILSPKNEAISCDSDSILHITGTVVSDEKGTPITSLSYKITVTDSLDSNTALGTITGRLGDKTNSMTLTSGTIGESDSISFAIDATKGEWKENENNTKSFDGRKPSDGNVFKYVITVFGTTGSEGNSYVTVQIDKKKPEVKTINISKLLTSGERKDCVNGTITINCTLTDNDAIAESRIEITGGTLTAPVTKTFAAGDRNPAWEYDTTKLPDKTEYTVTVHVKDTAGNTESASKTIFVDQDMDKPVINFTNGKYFSDATDWSNAVGGVNTFGVGSNNKVIFSFEDDDGLTDVKLTVYDEAGKLLPVARVEKQEGRDTAENPISYAFDSSTTGTVQYVLPKGEAPYKIVVEAVDTTYADADGREDADKIHSYRKTTTDNYIIVSDSNFVIDLDNKEIQTKEQDVTVTGTLSVTDIANIAEIHRYKAERVQDKWQKVGDPQSSYKAGQTNNSITVNYQTSADKTTWTDTVTASYLTEGEGNRFYYEATDKNGHRTYIYLTCKMDKTAPFIKLKTDATEWNKSGSQTIEVIVKDEEKGAFASGVDSVNATYTIGGAATSVTLARGVTCDENGNTGSSNKSYILYRTTLVGIPDSDTFPVRITATDMVGNTSPPLEPVFKIDTAAPVFGTMPEITAGLVLKSDKPIAVTYAVSDVTSGIAKVEFSTDSSMRNAQSTTVASGPFLYNLSHLSGTNGQKSLYVRATDVAGNSTDVEEAGHFIIDEKTPEVKITSPASGNTVNKKITVAGTVIEENLPADGKPVLQYKENGTAEWTTAAESAYTFVKDGQNWTISDFNTIPLNNSKETASKQFDFQITFTDVAGNSGASEAHTLNIDQNSDRPVVKVSFTEDNGSFRYGEKSFSGSVSDDDGTVQEIAIQIVPMGATPADGGWPEPSENSNEWTATVDNDGIYDVYFKVTDNVGTAFISGADALTAPKIQNSSADVSSTFITLSIDTTPPKINAVEASKKKEPTDADTYETVLNNSFLGGVVSKYARFQIDASDEVSKAEKLKVIVKIGETEEYTATYSSGVYHTDVIDLSAFPSGTYQFTITATDESGRAASLQRMITIDNAKPDTIKNVVPSATTPVTGDFSMTGLVQDDELANSGIPPLNAMSYYIPKNSEKDYTSDADLANLNWTTDNLTQTSLAWSINFSTLADKLGYSAATELLSEDYRYMQNPDNKDLHTVPVWFKVVDNVGNVGYIQGNTLFFNPNADKPIVTVTYPEMPDTGSLTMGGTVRLMGTASDNEGVDAVYLQFDFDGDGTYENGEGIAAAPTNPDGNVYVGGDYTNIVTDIPVKDGGMWKGFKARGTVSWSSSIDLSNFEAKKKIRIRAVAIDNDTENGRLAGAWSPEIVIEVDNNTPQITERKLVQYVETSYNTPVKEITYTEDIFISGNNWRLEGIATHDKGIKSISVPQNYEVETDDIDTKNTKFLIPINASSGKWNVTVTAVPNVEDSAYNSITTYSVQIDNTAPELETEDSAGLVIYKDSYGIQANRLGSAVHVQNSNGEYATITARLTEEGSGFERAVFYFERDGKDGDKRVYNVMKPCGANRTENRTPVVVAKADGAVYINSEGLAVLYKATVGRSNDMSIEIDDDNIRVGGLVKIGGAYHRIVGKSGGSISLADSVSTTFTDAEFVYGMVVDNTGESFNTSGALKNDDGDGMVESYSKSGSTYTWDAAIPSANIPDGPIQLHVVAFDKAGNSRHAFVNTRISNSPVRITSVKLATDLNGNNTFDATEENQFFAIKKSDGSGNTSVGVDVWTLDTKKELYGDSDSASCWTVKDRLAVRPEFVGGTAPFYCKFSKDVSGTLDEAEKYTAGTSGIITITANNEQFVLENDTLGTTDTCEGRDNVVYRFSFWDSTEELAPGEDTSWTVLNARVKQELTDSVPPTASISPFYWNSSTDNSLYENSRDKGHIELEVDLENGNFTDSSGEYDKDPKVSGTIKIQGVANDNKILKEIKMKIPGFMNDYTTVGAYAPESGWSSSGTLETDGWLFTIDEDEISQANGHTVSWTFTWNTSKINNAAACDVAVEVQATDQANRASGDSSTQTAAGAETPYYKMDVVPYITGVKTMLTELEKKNPSVYGRSALGAYPVYYYRKNASGIVETEPIVIEGFNISGGTVEFTGVKSPVSLGSDNSISIPSDAKSGEIAVITNYIRSLNNRNNNDASGSYDTELSAGTYKQYAYNRQPNGQNNDLLTDDVSLAIWDINSQAAKSKTGELSEVVMHVNPANGMLGFAFAHSQDLASYPNGTQSSYNTWITDWTGVNQIGFVFDSKGNMYGTNGGTDTYTPDKKVGRFGLISSHWGVIATDSASNDNVSGYTKYRRLRLEYLGLTQNGKYASNVYRFAKGDCSQFAVTTPSASPNLTNLYMMYYDNTLSELKFKGGTYNTSWGYGSGKDVNLEEKGFTKAAFSFGDFADDAHYEKDNASGTNYKPNYGTISIVANKDSVAQPGIYYSIAAVPSADGNSDVVVAVWYDDVNKSLWYSYLENPLANAGKRNSNGEVDTSWSKPVAILSGHAGGYCSIAVDEDEHIHIAAYSRNSAGSLYYAYLDTYNSSFSEENNLVAVDAYGSAGQYLRMEVARNEEGNTVPYISYWMNSMSYPKYTYLAKPDSSGKPKPGVDDDNMYTGAWESIILPTVNSIVLDDINIGVYRYQSDSGTHKKGEIQEIPRRAEVSGDVTGVAGGNGTSNPVLGYGIASFGQGYIETAQLK